MELWCIASIILIISFAYGDDEYHYHPDWVLKIKGNEDIAQKIAEENGFDYIGKVDHLYQTYHFKEKYHSRKRTKRNAEDKTKVLKANDKVFWVEQQKTLYRSKRNFVREYHKKTLRELTNDQKVRRMFNDPEWVKQWYLYDARESTNIMKLDLNVIPVWKMNITGRGVTVTIVDDGIEYTHPELKDNYDPQSSYDFNDNDDDPMPNTAPDNDHGTRCASEISMKENNGICGVGIAYNVKIGGIRMLDGKLTDLIEAKSLGFNNNHIDIYSSSWGPNDMGIVMERPGVLVEETFKEGVTNGRHGKGNIFVWAGGNGGFTNDSCSCDGYASSIYTIAINSINPDSTEPRYTEKCSSIMGATFSSNREQHLVAADVKGGCTDKFSGTSAAAPYAAGIFALALEANPELTWRDIKHLLTWTNQVSTLITTDGWKKNKAGFWVSEVFGFGQMDANKFVVNAKSWVTVPPLISCKLTKNFNALITNMISYSATFDGDQCYKKVKFIESILITMTFQYSERGALFITLTSPSGIKTTLLPLRFLDNRDELMVDWPFNTVHNWGEDPRGKWTVSIKDKKNNNEVRNGFVDYISMTFYGTATIPNHIKSSPNGKRIYDNNYNKVRNEKRVTKE